jgi:hypothetical protein
MPTATAYDARKARETDRQAKQSREGREIGPLPDVADSGRRNACLDDLRLYLESYFSARFPLAWGDDQLEMIDELQRKILSGGRSARAHPRGTGKTTIAECAALWAIGYGHRVYVPLVGASEEKAKQLLTSIKAEVETNDLLADDFPELCYPIRCLEGINNRAAGQTLDGKRTRIEWTAERIRFPLIPGAASSWACIDASGIDGAIRGKAIPAPGGGKWRPDMVLIDDFQTDASARSPAQCITRERTMAGAIMGLAGPGVKIAAVALCTVIRQGDAADSILDRGRNPEWEGVRSKLLRSMPTDLVLWDQYGDLLRAGLRKQPRDRGPANEFYAVNREAMDAGAVSSWPARFEPDQLSAVQYAMDLYILSPETFAAEYQNEPLAGNEDDGAEPIDAAALAEKVNKVPRGEVPAECTRLTCGIDVQQELIFWSVTGWDEKFGGSVIDYGTFPRQPVSRFSASDPQVSLSSVYQGRKLSLEARIYAGLEEVARGVLAREWPRHGGGPGLRIERCLADSGHWTDTVHQWARQSVAAAILTPSKGQYVGAAKTPFSEWKPQPGDRLGPGWRIKGASGARGRLVLVDTNHWKTFLAERCRSAPGTPGALMLFGNSPAAHATFTDHFGAEHPVRLTSNERTVDEWTQNPGRPDNHWFDAAILAAVGASVAGLKWSAAAAAGEGSWVKPAKPKRESWAETQKRKMAERGTAQRA